MKRMIFVDHEMSIYYIKNVAPPADFYKEVSCTELVQQQSMG